MESRSRYGENVRMDADNWLKHDQQYAGIFVIEVQDAIIG